MAGLSVWMRLHGDVEGVGSFTLIIKQKKDKMAQVAVEGGYSVS